MTALVIEHAHANGVVGRLLLFRIERRDDRQAARVCVVLVLVVHGLAHHFGHILGMHVVLVARGPGADRFVQCIFVLVARDVAQVEHALEDVFLTDFRALRIDDRIVGRRRLRQAGQHGGLAKRDVLEILAEVDARGAREAVSALAQIDLVHVQLENLVLRQRGLDLVREQHFVDLARGGLLAREEEVARDLHGDRAGTLRGAAVQYVRHPGSQDADEVDAAMIVETIVLDREHGLLHHVRNLVDRDETAALLAEFADQHVIGRVDAQRHLRTVIGNDVEWRQVGAHHDQRITDDQGADDRQASERGQDDGKRAEAALTTMAAGRGSRRLGCDGGGVLADLAVLARRMRRRARRQTMLQGHTQRKLQDGNRPAGLALRGSPPRGEIGAVCHARRVTLQKNGGEARKAYHVWVSDGLPWPCAGRAPQARRP